MTSLADLEQGSEEWHQRRRVSIGSSDASVIMRCDPYRTYQELLEEKRGRPRQFKMNDAMVLGTKWESGAREMFNFSFDQDVKPMVGISDDHSFLLASFDGLCEAAKIFVEIKYAGHKKVELVKKTKTLPPHHYAQMQHQFLVSGFDKASYVAYALSEDKRAITKIAYIEVLRDDPYLAKLLAEELKFWSILNSSTPESA